MLFRTSLLSLLAKGHTSQPNAWKDGYYDSYRLMFELPAVRVHSRFRSPAGRWFAVDTYDVSLTTFQHSMALVTSNGQPWFFKRPDLAWYLLLPGTVVNVGLAAEQGFHEGGGLQFEFVSGRHAQLLDQAADRKRVRL